MTFDNDALNSGSPDATVQAQESLGQKASKWKKALSSGVTGPLIIAQEVIEILDDWDEWKSEAQGQTESEWTRQAFGKGRSAAWFRRRARAVSKLGEHVRRQLHHEVAVWVADLEIPVKVLPKVLSRLTEAFNSNSRVPLELGPARKVVESIIGPQTRGPAVCGACVELRAWALKAQAVLGAHGLLDEVGDLP